MRGSGRVRQDRLLPYAALVAIALVWGSTHLVAQAALEHVSVPTLLALRFSVAAVGLAWCRPDRRAWRSGLVPGGLLFAVYVVHTTGLLGTTATNAAFVMGCSALIVPLLLRLTGGRVPPRAWSAGALGVLGLAVLLFGAHWRLAWGDAWQLLASALFALYLVVLSRASKGCRALPLTCVQLVVMAAAAWLWVWCAHADLTALPTSAWLAATYLGFVANVFVMCLQVYAVKFVPIERVALWLQLEPVFAVLLTFAVWGTAPAWTVWLGGSIVLAALARSSPRSPNTAGSGTRVEPERHRSPA